MTESKYIHITGLVQGVGFRPFIYRLAHQYSLNGWVENRNDGVNIKVEGPKKQMEEFIHAIRLNIPEASHISALVTEQAEVENFQEFFIRKSENVSSEVTEISPDIAVCKACVKDLDVQEHRLDYPFINCTNCGPRFTIIKDLPYDRDKTTMAPFRMCGICGAEYGNILNRRFHAQPVACNVCGPNYTLKMSDGIIDDFHQLLDKVVALLEDGKIIAIKGIGGYQLSCNASDEPAVSRLREMKNREGKPFAVMFRDIESIREICHVNETEEKALLSWRRPIIILKEKESLAKSVSNGFGTIGTMLPNMPFHHLLFRKLRLNTLVMTSGNISDEPIVIDNLEAVKTLGPICDAVLSYNRDIHNRVDDSVAFSASGNIHLIRRARGYVPQPVETKLNTEGIFAAGAELVNCFAIGKGNQVMLSQHIGDLQNLETLEFYKESFERFQSMFRLNVSHVVHDLHPDYLSSGFAADLNLPVIKVQHHHAHIASCMAEHHLDEKVIGVSFDGTGLGDDGHIWGGEFLIADLAEYIRFTHFEYIPMPGGDMVTKQPWRTAVSYLYHYFGESFRSMIPEQLVDSVDPKHLGMILQAIGKNINCPLSSSAGRLFDAVAALLNLCSIAKFHAEAPMRLEAAINGSVSDFYSADMGSDISFKSVFQAIINDLDQGIPVDIISAKFHNTIINTIFTTVSAIRDKTGIQKVVCSGGTFQNRYIIEGISNVLRKNGFQPYFQQNIPSNDGGIALGQLVIAAKRRELGIFEE
jgi:hydrogenase maturation protein HypF